MSIRTRRYGVGCDYSYLRTYEWGGGRTPLLQEKIRLTSAAYRREQGFVTAFEAGVWERREQLEVGPQTNVYFIAEVGEEGPFKIGRSEQPLSRLAQMRANNPRALVLVAAAPATSDLETFIHQQLSKDCFYGEWFTPTPRVLALADLFRGVAQMTQDLMTRGGENFVSAASTISYLTCKTRGRLQNSCAQDSRVDA